MWVWNIWISEIPDRGDYLRNSEWAIEVILKGCESTSRQRDVRVGDVFGDWDITPIGISVGGTWSGLPMAELVSG